MQLLQKRGVAIGLRADSYNQQTLTGEAGKYISENWAHYAWDDGDINHAVTIIGWDDDYPKENFLAEHQPPANGAWLVKNSWGSGEEAFPFRGRGDWGIENGEGKHTGYFWVSYFDHSISDPEAFELDIAVAPQIIDQHDYMQVNKLNTQTYTDPVSMANVFKVDHSKILSAISCITAAEKTSVWYQVYLLPDAYQSPEDGLLATEGLVSFDDAGFHRIPIDEICLQKDQYFSVIVTLANQGGAYDAVMPMAGGFVGLNNQQAILNERESHFRQDGQWQDYKQIADAMIAAMIPSEAAGASSSRLIISPSRLIAIGWQAMSKSISFMPTRRCACWKITIQTCIICNSPESTPLISAIHPFSGGCCRARRASWKSNRRMKGQSSP